MWGKGLGMKYSIQQATIGNTTLVYNLGLKCWKKFPRAPVQCWSRNLHPSIAFVHPTLNGQWGKFPRQYVHGLVGKMRGVNPLTSFLSRSAGHDPLREAPILFRAADHNTLQGSLLLFRAAITIPCKSPYSSLGLPQYP